MAVDALIVGTTHFHDHPSRVLSDAGQREIEEVCAELSDWGPTKVAVEIDPATTDPEALFARWSSGQSLPANEAAQLGYRVAARLGPARLFAVDLIGRFYDEDVERLTAHVPEHRDRWERLVASIEAEARDMHARLEAGTIRDLLVHLNSPDSLHRTLAIYYEHLLPLADEAGDPGPTMIANWYARNVRIAANIVRIADPGDRVLVIYGSGHVPLLRHSLAHVPGWQVHDYPPSG